MLPGMLTDRYELPLSTASSAARDAYVEGCEAKLTMYPGAIEAFDRAIAADPGFALAHAARAHALLERGDAFLETVRSFTPPSGDLSEQFDRKTGAQTSARHLAWSYAALISCIAARRAVVG